MVPGVWCSAHVPHMFRTSWSAHVPNMFRTSRNAISTNIARMRCPRDLKFEKSGIFENCLHFSLLKNQILKIAIFTISMRPKIQIPTFHENLGACSAHVPHISCSEQCSGPTKTIRILEIYESPDQNPTFSIRFRLASCTDAGFTGKPCGCLFLTCTGAAFFNTNPKP